MLWGDSHAAHLIPGMKKYFGDDFNILQRTGTNLSAVVTTGDSVFEKNNRAVFNDILRIKPDVVILSSAWQREWGKLHQIESTLSTLKKSGVKKIVIIGPSPYFRDSLPRILARFWLQEGSFPMWLNWHDKHQKIEKIIETDVELHGLSKKWGVDYVSSVAILCRGHSCLTQVDGSNIPLYFDSNHFTVAGSEYFVEQIKKNSNLLQFF